MAEATKRPLRVFLCHAKADKPAVRVLYKQLIENGVDAWLDEEKLTPGQNWRIEIAKAVRKTDAVIICLSQESVTKEGYVQTEIKFALDIAKEKPINTIYIIPAKLENCDVPLEMDEFHWVNLFFNGTNFENQEYDKLIRALQIRAEKVRAKSPVSNKAQAITDFAPPEKPKRESTESAERELKEKVAREKLDREVAESTKQELKEKNAREKEVSEGMKERVDERRTDRPLSAKRGSNNFLFILGILAVCIICSCSLFFYIDINQLWCSFFPFISGC